MKLCSLSWRHTAVGAIAAGVLALTPPASQAGVLPGQPALRRLPAVSPAPTAPVGVPETRRDVVLASVSCRVDDGPEQLGPVFLADLADIPTRIRFRVAIGNRGSETVLVSADLQDPPFQLLRSQPSYGARVAPGSSETVEFEYQLRGLDAALLAELPLTVALVTSTDYVDDHPGNNTCECTLLLGRPDLAVAEVELVPNVKPDFIQPRDIVHPEVQVQAFVTVKNCGTGRLPPHSATLHWLGSVGFRGGEAMELRTSRPLGLRRGDATSQVDLPSLHAGEYCVVRLEQTSSGRGDPMGGTVRLDLRLDCAPIARKYLDEETLETMPYQEMDQLNNENTFHLDYYAPIARSLVPRALSTDQPVWAP